MVSLLYGAGLRQSGLLNLRIKDVNFELNTLTVYFGKGDKDHTTLLPTSLLEPPHHTALRCVSKS